MEFFTLLSLNEFIICLLYYVLDEETEHTAQAHYKNQRKFMDKFKATEFNELSEELNGFKSTKPQKFKVLKFKTLSSMPFTHTISIKALCIHFVPGPPHLCKGTTP